MKTKMKKLVLVAALGAILGGCAAPSPSQPEGPRVPVNTPEKIEAFKASEEIRLQAVAAEEAAKKAAAEQLARENERLEYLKAKQKHLESLPRGLPPVTPTKRRVVRKKAAEPAASTAAAVAVPAVPADKAEAPPATPAPAKAAVPAPETGPAYETTTPTHKSGPTFTPRRSTP